MTARTRAAGIALLLNATLLSSYAGAQTAIVRPDRLPEPGRSVVTGDDSTAIAGNPANLSFMPDSELRWSSVYLDEDATVPWQGHAVSFAGQVPLLSMATGLRLDLLAPPDASGLLVDHHYQWLTWGLAMRAGRTSALGLSIQGSFSGGAWANDLTSFSLGYTYRPFDALAFSFVAHDINAPRNNFYELDRSYDGGIAIRPLGSSAVELSVESSYVTEQDVWTPRAVLGMDIPYVGRLRGDFEMSNPTRKSERAWLASAGLSIYMNNMRGSSELGGGVLTGNGLGTSDSYNPYTSFAVKGFRENTGIEPARYGIRIRVEDTPSSRVHVAFLRQLWSLAEEPNIDAVVFEMRAAPAASLANAQELRDAIFELRRAGKRTLCHLEAATGSAMYVCAAANQTVVNPAGGLRFTGLRSQHIYLARVLENLGVRADYVRIGPHKSAPEQFSETRATDVARADKIDLLQQYERHFAEGMALGRNLSVKEVRERLSHGPFAAREAKEAGLIDGYAYDDQIQKRVNELTGRKTPLRSDQRARTARATHGNEGFVAVVHVNGDLVDGRSRALPLIGMDVAGSYTIADTLKAVRENKEFKAVVVRVDSPGGSSMAADVMWREVLLTAKVKPTVVSMGTVAASGGYYLAAGATRVFANPLSVTGSIGVFYAKADVSQLLNRVGIDIEVYKTQSNADAESFYRPFTADERKELERQVKHFYQVFVGRVAQGRKMTKEAVDAVGQGRVWTGEQALAHGLIDELGGLRQAIAYARQKAGLSEDAPLVELPKINQSLLSQLIGVPGLHAKTNILDAPMPNGFTKTLRALGPFVVHPGDVPLARLDFTINDFE